MTPEVRLAVDQIIKQFPRQQVVVAEDQTGGACVIVDGEPLGPPYEQADTWIGFHITDQCPYADTYPHFVRPDLTRKDGNPLGEAMTAGHTFPAADVLRNKTEMPSRTCHPAVAAVKPSRPCRFRDPADQALQGDRMDTAAIAAGQWRMVFPESLYEKLRNHLFPGNGDEHGAVIAAGLARMPDGEMRLLARNLFLAADGQDYIAGKRGYKMLKAEFVRDRGNELPRRATRLHGYSQPWWPRVCRVLRR